MTSERPKLGPVDATLLVMGGILGVGIFFTPQKVAAEVPGPGAFFALWGVGAVLALVGGLTFAELGRAFPRAGGWFVYLDEAWGRFLAFLFAWVVLAVISTGALSVMVVYVGVWLSQGTGLEVPPRAVGATAIVALTAIALGGAKVGARFQSACMLLKLTAVVALVVGAFAFFTPPEVAVASAREAPPLARGLARGILPVLFAVGGWQMLNYVASEVRTPERNVPRALLAGVVAVTICYFALNAAYLRVLSFDELAADGGFASVVAARVFGEDGGRWLSLGLAVSALGVTTVTLLATPWLYVAMARRGLFFSRFGRLSPRTGAPSLALLLQAAIALAYLAWGDAGLLVDATVFVEWFFHAAVAAGLIALRRRRADLPAPLLPAAHPWAPLVYLVLATAIVLGSLAQADADTLWLGLGVLGAGALAYPLFRRAR